MSRRWLGLALLLSVGVNLGILATLAVERLRDGSGPPAPAAEAVGSVEALPGADAEAGRGSEPGGEDPPGAPADPSGRAPVPPEVGHRLEILADRMGLDGEERRKFLEIQRRFFRDTFHHRQELLLRQRALRRELVAARPDRDRVAEALERLAEARDALDRSMVETVLASRELLDPAQEREYLRFVGRMRAAGEGRRPGGPPLGRGPRRP